MVPRLGIESAADTARPLEGSGPKLLAIVAHPDDESVFAATAWRIIRELGGTVDQVIVTDGAGGNRYAAAARHIYGIQLDSDDASSRAWLTAIRREETRAAARILGLRDQYFLDQPDSGFTLDADGTLRSLWDDATVSRSIQRLLEHEQYDFVLLLLPTPDTHGHHQAAAVLALDAIAALPAAERPVVLAAEVAHSRASSRYAAHPRYPITRVLADAPVFKVDRRAAFAGDPALDYHMVVNWIIAEHKSQGLVQKETNRYDMERFHVLAAGHPDSASRAAALFRLLSIRTADELRTASARQ